jgi:hypothetical protein
VLALCPFIPELVALSAYVLQPYLVNARQLLVDRHRVVGFASGLREFPFQEFVERTPGCQDLALRAVPVNGRELDPRRIVLSLELLRRQ